MVRFSRFGMVAAVGLLASGFAAQAATPIDPQMQAVLDAQAKLGVKPIETLKPDQAREQPSVADGQKELLDEEHKSTDPEAVASVDNMSIPGPDGKIKIRIYTPESPTKQPLPVIVYWHGGGFVIADLDTYDATPRALANLAHAIVVSADYRQGPEHRLPAAHDDALAAYQWVTSHASTFGGDPARIAVAGESAGGNLAAYTAIEARDRHLPLPVYQLLVYPVAGGGFDQPSYVENADAKPLNTAMVKWFVMNYEASPDDVNKLPLSLVSETNFAGLPPATVITAGHDPLNSEGRAYAKLLLAAGVPVQFRNYPGMTHEFFGLGATVLHAREAEEFAGANLAGAFSGGMPASPSDEQP